MVIELVAAGLATGLVAGMFGVGGGFLLVPLLTALGLPLREAIGTSLAFIVVVGAVGGTCHLRQLTADPLLALPVVATSAVFAQLGAQLAYTVGERVLSLLFAATLVAVAAWSLVRGAPQDGDGARPPARHPRLWLDRQRKVPGRDRPLRYGFDIRAGAAVGAVGGTASGMLGVSGGLLVVPLLAGALAVPQWIASGTGLLASLATAASAVVAYALRGAIAFDHLAALAPAGALGALAGARISPRLSARTLRHTLAALLLIASAKPFTYAIG